MPPSHRTQVKISSRGRPYLDWEPMPRVPDEYLECIVYLDKAPAILDEEKETPTQRLVKLEGYLKNELAVHGNSLYAQDLKDTISTIENRKW